MEMTLIKLSSKLTKSENQTIPDQAKPNEPTKQTDKKKKNMNMGKGPAIRAEIAKGMRNTREN